MIIKLMNCNQKSKIIPITIVWKMINYNIKSKNKKCLWIIFAKQYKRIW